VLKYNEYQTLDNQTDNQLTNKRQTVDKQLTTTNKDNNLKNDNKEPKKQFVPPTILEIETYCLDRKNNVNPSKFLDFYESKGWMIGKNKMKSWKAAVRTWEQNNNNKTKDDKPLTTRYKNAPGIR
jgi:hypothetical protein